MTTDAKSANTNETITTSGSDGPVPGDSAPGATCPPNCGPSAAPSSGSKRRWRKPRTVKEVTAQATTVATMLLNGEIDLETARAYSGLARTMAQTVTAELMRARFLQRQPDLTVEGAVFEDEDHDG